MAKVIKLSKEEYAQFSICKIYEGLPTKIREVFNKEEVVLGNTSIVFPATNELNRYIVDSSSRFLKIFLIYVLEVSEEKTLVKILERTPTYSDDIETYPIYSAGIPLAKSKTLFISGEERKELKDEKQLKKWDYFFYASKEELIHRHLYMLDEFNELEEKAIVQLKEEGGIIGALLLCCFILSFFIGKLIAVLILGLGLFLLWNNIKKGILLFGNIRTLRMFSSRLNEEKEYLESQMVQIKTSGKQIEQWLNEEITILDTAIATEFELPKVNIKRLQWKEIKKAKIDPKNDITGLIIDEWGYFQPFSTNGKKTLSRKYWHHLHALRFHNNRPLVGAYYITFIYLTEETLAVSSFFYDFILSRRFGQTTNQYYYRDIVSIGTAIKESKVFDDEEELETEQVIISFYNNEKIAVTLTDKVTIENLREKVHSQSKFSSDEEDAIGDISRSSIDDSNNTPELDQLFELNDNLPGTRVKAIVKTIKQFWNEKKNIKLPPSKDAPSSISA